MPNANERTHTDNTDRTGNSDGVTMVFFRIDVPLRVHTQTPQRLVHLLTTLNRQIEVALAARGRASASESDLLGGSLLMVVTGNDLFARVGVTGAVAIFLLWWTTLGTRSVIQKIRVSRYLDATLATLWYGGIALLIAYFVSLLLVKRKPLESQLPLPT